jgi:hypothetical protein
LRRHDSMLCKKTWLNLLLRLIALAFQGLMISSD